jgi:hypothetical protein
MFSLMRVGFDFLQAPPFGFRNEKPGKQPRGNARESVEPEHHRTSEQLDERQERQNGKEIRSSVDSAGHAHLFP